MHGLIEPELFYMPCRKKIKYIYLNFQELLHTNYDKMLNDYPEYTDDILKYDKYGSLLTDIPSQTEFMFLDSNHNPIFKACPNIRIDYSIRIDNIPYGKYYVKIIKSKGYLLDEFEIIVDANSNEKIYNIILKRSTLKIEMGTEQTESNNDYKFITSYPSSYYGVSCESSGRLYYKFYDPNGEYLGKKIVGCAMIGIGVYNNGLFLKYYPLNLNAQYTEIIDSYSTEEYRFEGNNLQDPLENDRILIGIVSSVNLPLFYKKFNEKAISEIQTTIIWSNGNVHHSTTQIGSGYYYGEKREENYIEYFNVETQTTIRESIGYNFYFEDGMTDDINDNIDKNLLSGKDPHYLFIDSNSGKLYSTKQWMGINRSYPYYENLYSDDYTLYLFTNYLLTSDDYDDYEDFQRVWSFDFNAKKEGEN